MAKLNFKQEMFNGPIPGESFTVDQGKYPFDRPPQITNAEKALEVLFNSMSQPAKTNKLLDAMDDEVPIDSIASVILHQMYGEGVIPIQLGVTLYPSVVTILDHMAKTAGIKPVYSTQFGTQDAAQKISPDDFDKKLASKTPQVPEENSSGFMQKPEGMME